MIQQVDRERLIKLRKCDADLGLFSAYDYIHFFAFDVVRISTAVNDILSKEVLFSSSVSGVECRELIL